MATSGNRKIHASGTEIVAGRGPAQSARSGPVVVDQQAVRRCASAEKTCGSGVGLARGQPPSAGRRAPPRCRRPPVRHRPCTWTPGRRRMVSYWASVIPPDSSARSVGRVSESASACRTTRVGTRTRMSYARRRLAPGRRPLIWTGNRGAFMRSTAGREQHGEPESVVGVHGKVRHPGRTPRGSRPGAGSSASTSRGADGSARAMRIRHCCSAGNVSTRLADRCPMPLTTSRETMGTRGVTRRARERRRKR